MSESTNDLLVRGTAAARVGEVQEAKFYLEWLLSLDPDEEEKLEAMFWLARCSDDPQQKRDLLEKVLASQPHHFLARREWMILQGRLSSSDVIDPNLVARSTANTSNGTANAKVKSLVCPNCGGKMVYSPDGTTLVCEYCEVSNRKQKEFGVVQKDFLLSLSTIKGHSVPAGQPEIACQQCGAVFIKGMDIISVTCPFCESSLVVETLESKAEIAPSSIFPARVSKNAAAAIFLNWCKTKGMNLLRGSLQLHGIYLPAWWFAIGGSLHYRYMIENNRHIPVAGQGSQPILRDNLCVPAGKRFSAELREIIQSLNFDWMRGYSPEYLADWLAETYQVTVADASLEARSICLSLEKRKANLSIPAGAEDIVFDSHDMVVESYQLCLIPIWMAFCSIDGESDNYIIDALNGTVIGPEDEPRSFWDKLMNW
jgi:uncharacterized Zn finger protein (UPF0148 family)